MGSNPFNACSSNSDQDGDGYCDNEEIAMGSDMLDPCSPDGTDSDLDGLCNSQELASGSDPNDTCDPFEGDADGDGLCDHLEGIIGSSAEDPAHLMVKTRMETDSVTSSRPSKAGTLTTPAPRRRRPRWGRMV